MGVAADAPLDRRRLLLGVERLAERDADLAEVVTRHGPPPMWARRPGFSTLVRIILEQQVSLQSADAAFTRLRAAAGRLTPRRFLELSDGELRRLGFSRQKTGYCRDLAERITSRSLELGRLQTLDPDGVAEQLTAVKGIGPWTVAIYRLMVLRHPDVWPRGDVALAASAQQIKRMPQRPSDDELHELSRYWRPWRSVAARLLWHDYLRTRALRQG